MPFITRHTYRSIVAFLFLFLCTIWAQAQIPLLRSVSHKIPRYIDYWSYNQNNQPISIISTTKDSSTVLMFYSFIRDKNNLLKTTEVKDVSTTVIYSFNYYYNTANQVEKIEKLSDMDYDGKADDLDHIFTFKYDSLGKVVNFMIKKNSIIARDFTFTWENGNVIEVNNADGDLNYRMKLAYDQIPNMLEPIKWEYLTTTGTLEFYVTMFSANNLIQAELFPAGMDSSTLEIRPEYDGDGLYRSNRMEGVVYEYIYK